MGRPRKSGPPSRVQRVIAVNLQIAIETTYRAETSDTARYKRFAKDAGTSLSQVQRAVTGTAAIGVDILERFADTLRTRVSDLVTEGAFATLLPPSRIGRPRPTETTPS